MFNLPTASAAQNPSKLMALLLSSEMRPDLLKAMMAELSLSIMLCLKLSSLLSWSVASLIF
jgi:hypothetical protein